MQDKPRNHQANIVRISNILPHTNADTLELIHIDGYQVVVKKGSFKVGDLGVYIQPDSIVPQTEPFRFIWEPYINGPDKCQHVDSIVATNDQEVCTRCYAQTVNGVTQLPEKRRRITVRKFRKEWSEGLLLPITDFAATISYCDDVPEGVTLFDDATITICYEGDDISALLGVTHYDPDKGRESTTGENASAPKRSRWPRSFRGWVYFLLSKLGFHNDTYGSDRESCSFSVPYYDVKNYKHYGDIFEVGEMVNITEKVHGSNARYVFLDGKMYAGSRTLWKSPQSKCVWRKALEQNSWIEEWCRAYPGYVLFGEVTPTQPGFDYGCRDGQVKFLMFDILNLEGEWVDYDKWNDFRLSGEWRKVPQLYYGPYQDDHLHRIVDGPSWVQGAKHIREGIVIRSATEKQVPGVGRKQLKLVSNAFLEKDSK